MTDFPKSSEYIWLIWSERGDASLWTSKIGLIREKVLSKCSCWPVYIYIQTHMLHRVTWSNNVQALQGFKILGLVGGPSSYSQQHSAVTSHKEWLGSLGCWRAQWWDHVSLGRSSKQTFATWLSWFWASFVQCCLDKTSSRRGGHFWLTIAVRSRQWWNCSEAAA